jgi:hypothetical protein
MDPAVEKAPARNNRLLSLQGASPALTGAATRSAANVNAALYAKSERPSESIGTMNSQTSFLTKDRLPIETVDASDICPQSESCDRLMTAAGVTGGVSCRLLS